MQIISVEQRIYVGSVGITFELVCKNYSYETVDLDVLKGGSGTATILLQKPDGTQVTKAATISGTNKDTITFTNDSADDFAVPGTYSLQGRILNEVNNKDIYTEPVEFQVRQLFDEERIVPEE